MKNRFNKTNSHKGGYASLMFELMNPTASPYTHTHTHTHTKQMFERRSALA